MFVAKENNQAVKHRSSSASDQAAVFTDIYQEQVNMVIWQRRLATGFQSSLARFIENNLTFQTSGSVEQHNVISFIKEMLANNACAVELGEDIAELVDMFCCLFGVQKVGLRLTVLEQAMCPRFHVDRVPCRLVTTYQGAGTEWLPHQAVNRSMLGAGSNGVPDNQSGLYNSANDICRINSGDVALLKGELWENNENAGLVHRSPAIAANKPRLLLTLDFLD